MPSTNVYTPQRRMVMQIVLFVVLIGAVGLAALVDRQLGGVGLMQLGPPQSSGPLHFRLPAGWVIVTQIDGDPRVAAVAATPDGHRKIIVYRQRLRQLMPPGDYLDQVGLLSEIFGDQPPVAVDTTLAGQPAIRLEAELQITTPELTYNQSEIVVCCVFPNPNRQAVTLRLTKRGEFTPADEHLFDEIARNITVN